MDTPQHNNTCPGGHEIYNFGRPFLGHQTYILSLSVRCLGLEKKIFKEILHFPFLSLITIHLVCMDHAPQ